MTVDEVCLIDFEMWCVAPEEKGNATEAEVKKVIAVAVAAVAEAASRKRGSGRPEARRRRRKEGGRTCNQAWYIY